MSYAALASRWALAIILASAGIAKLGDSAEVASSIARYGIWPASRPGVARVLGRFLPACELALALWLASGLLPWLSGSAVALMFMIFGAALAWNLLHGRHFDCGCGLGPEQTISWPHAGRAVLLAGMATVSVAGPVSLAIDFGQEHAALSTVQAVPVPLTIILLGACLRLVTPARASIRAPSASSIKVFQQDRSEDQ